MKHNGVELSSRCRRSTIETNLEVHGRFNSPPDWGSLLDCCELIGPSSGEDNGRNFIARARRHRLQPTLEIHHRSRATIDFRRLVVSNTSGHRCVDLSRIWWQRRGSWRIRQCTIELRGTEMESWRVRILKCKT